jgi:hypothetical protein
MSVVSKHSATILQIVYQNMVTIWKLIFVLSFLRIIDQQIE